MNQRPPHLPLISQTTLKKWELRSSNIENAFRKAGTFGREKYIRAPRAGLPMHPSRCGSCVSRRLAPMTRRLPLKTRFMHTCYMDEATMKCTGPRFDVSPFDPGPYFLRGADGRPAVVIATQSGDLIGCG